MGQPRFLSACVIAALCAACGAKSGDLLGVADVGEVYAAGAGGAGYGPSSMDPGSRGVITGKVTYLGRKRIRPADLSTEFCLDAHPGGMMSEDFLVAGDGGLANIIVYIKSGLDGEKWDVPSAPAVLDQVKCQYVPHVIVIQRGQGLIIRNSDATMHNVHGEPAANAKFNLPMSTVGELAPRVFERAEEPFLIRCDVHGWMASYLAVLDHPCHAVTGPDGTFRIEGVPPGKYQLAAWHEKLGELTDDAFELAPGETRNKEITFK